MPANQRLGSFVSHQETDSYQLHFRRIGYPAFGQLVEQVRRMRRQAICLWPSNG